ncbi:MAG: helix-turn-helix transcriptional regulator [Verrucomicrobia bacterium]|nr:helix-turn-helix transcriptional regulator [Verrucomicrobiota bacterium]
MNLRQDSSSLFLDQIRARVTVAGIQTMPAGWSLPRRTLPCHDIIHVLAGTGVARSGARRAAFRAPAWLVLPAREAHSLSGEGLRLAVVHVAWTTPDQRDALSLLAPDLPLSPALPAELDRLFEHAITAWLQHSAAGSASANRWMELWLTRAFGDRLPASRLDPRLVDALAWLHRHLGTPVRLDALARFVGLSAAHLRSLFLRQLGNSPKRVLQELRLTQAYALLEAGGTTAADAAARLGWRDRSAFNKSFRRRFGCSPGSVRRRTASDLVV